MEWKIDGFDASAWEDIKKTIAEGEYCTDHSDYFGAFECGALCYDIVLRDVEYSDGVVTEWILCADAYLLGWDTGYGYTVNGTPYEEGDGTGLEFDLNDGFEETLASFIEQLDKATVENKTWLEYANKTEPRWEDEE